MNTPYLLDTDNGKLMGVCSGFARWTNTDPTLVRVATVLIALAAPPVALIGYLVAGMVAPR